MPQDGCGWCRDESGLLLPSRMSLGPRRVCVPTASGWSCVSREIYKVEQRKIPRYSRVLYHQKGTRTHNGDKRQVALAGLGDLAARKHPHAIGVQQQADHHRWLKRGSPPGFILIRRIEPAQIQLWHQIEQEEDHIALRQFGV